MQTLMHLMWQQFERSFRSYKTVGSQQKGFSPLPTTGTYLFRN